ncbi:MAG: regulatory protein RecX [Nitrospirota bacterium]|nr:regulatory protein RecX [Nitrospirota bacterium]
MKPLPSPSRSAAPPDHAAERLEQAALRYLTRRDRTEAQVRAYLERAGAAPTVIATLLGQFRRRGYVNDAAYAGRWVEARLTQRPMGRDRLEAELMAQGFEPPTIEAALARAYAGRTEEELAQALLRQRGRLQTAAKQATLLRRHGFSDDIIQHCVGDQDS